jgi:hypothetical protein
LNHFTRHTSWKLCTTTRRSSKSISIVTMMTTWFWQSNPSIRCKMLATKTSWLICQLNLWRVVRTSLSLQPWVSLLLLSTIIHPRTLTSLTTNRSRNGLTWDTNIERSVSLKLE